MPHTFTLKTIALSSAAVSLWDSIIIQKEVKNYFSKNSSQYCFEKNYNKWINIEDKVVDMLTSIQLPENVKHELEDTIKIVGQKIFSWSKYVTLELGLHIKCVEKIYWTSNGSIDEVKIFQDFWLSNPNFINSKRKRSPNAVPSFRIGCLFMPEQFILNNNLENMKKVVQSFCAKISRAEKFKQTNSQVQADLKRLHLQHLYQTVKLFFQCIYSGLYKIVKYLVNEAINDILQHILNLAVKVCLEETLSMDNIYIKENLLKILLFLSNKLPLEDKLKLFATETSNILNMFLCVWPYHEQCPQILDFIMNGSSRKLSMSFLKTYMNGRYLIEQPKPLSDVQKLAFYKILENLMAKLPRGIKIVYFIQKSVMTETFKALDFSILKLIINDKDLLDQRYYFIELGIDVFKEFINEGRFEVYESFVKEVLKCYDEKIIFQQKIKFLSGFITEEKYELAEKYLNHVSISEERKLRIKRRIGLMTVCSSLIKENTDLELINQILETESMDEEKKQNAIKIYDALLNGVCYIWCTKFTVSEDEAMAVLSEFLIRFLKPQKLEYFKKEKLMKNENFIPLFCSHLMKPEDFKIIDELCKFCSVSFERINGIKSKIIENLDWWIDFYAIRQNKFLIIHYIVEWIFEDNFEKIQVLQRFINSDAGALLCTKIIREELYDEQKDEILKLLNFWIKPSESVDILMVKINEMDLGDGINKTFIISMISSLYDDKMVDVNTAQNNVNNEILISESDSDFELQQIILADIQQRKFDYDCGIGKEENFDLDSNHDFVDNC